LLSAAAEEEEGVTAVTDTLLRRCGCPARACAVWMALRGAADALEMGLRGYTRSKDTRKWQRFSCCLCG
jgi:hypothetical protein